MCCTCFSHAAAPAQLQQRSLQHSLQPQECCCSCCRSEGLPELAWHLPQPWHLLASTPALALHHTYQASHLGAAKHAAQQSAQEVTFLDATSAPPASVVSYSMLAEQAPTVSGLVTLAAQSVSQPEPFSLVV